MPDLLDAPELLDSPTLLDGGGGLTFTPPVVYDMGPINPETTGNQRRLFGNYSPHARGLNIWKLPNGSYSQDQPYPLVTPQDAQDGILPQGQAIAVTYLLVYYGGHSYVVTEAEKAALVAAGYGNCFI